MARHAKYVEDVATAMSIKFNNFGNAMKAAGEDVTICSFGEAFFDIPLYPFDTLPFPELYHYSDSRGLIGLREKLGAYYHTQYGVPVDAASEILVTAGSKLGVHMSFMALLEPGDEVVVPEPAWVSYSEQVRLCHGNPVMVPRDVPVAELGRWVTPRTRALVISSPHNPTGKVFSRDEIRQLHQIATEHGLYLISDEAYSDFVTEDEPFVSCGVDDPEKEHTIICNTMSKNYGMSGLLRYAGLPWAANRRKDPTSSSGTSLAMRKDSATATQKGQQPCSRWLGRWNREPPQHPLITTTGPRSWTAASRTSTTRGRGSTRSRR